MEMCFLSLTILTFQPHQNLIFIILILITKKSNESCSDDGCESEKKHKYWSREICTQQPIAVFLISLITLANQIHLSISLWDTACNLSTLTNLHQIMSVTHTHTKHTHQREAAYISMHTQTHTSWAHVNTQKYISKYTYTHF